MSSGDRRFCKTCDVWVSSHPANFARHEASDLHKGNIRKKIKEADEIRKQEKADKNATNPPANSNPKSHPLDSSFDVVIKNPQKEPVWIACRTEAGRIYYANRETGVSQWHKPVELGGVAEGPPAEKPQAEPVVPPEPRQALPPRPKTSAIPPRPKTSAIPPRPKTTTQNAGTAPPLPRPPVGDTKLLDAVLAPQDSPESPRRIVDPSTGFGEWETIQTVVDVLPKPELQVRSISEFKRPIDPITEDDASFSRIVTKKNRRVTREDDD